MMIKHIITLIRVKHWIKNILIFLPAFFGGVINESNKLVSLFFAFAFFSLTASLVYIFNDVLDIHKDRLHPTKKSRPLASGELTLKVAYIIAALLVFLLISTSFLLPVNVLFATGGYLLMNIFYSLELKKTAIVELFIVAVGFVFRIFIGGFAGEVTPSKWIVMLTFFGALYIVISKRRGELLTTKEENRRDVLSNYSIEYLNLAMIILATVSIMAYIMYTVEPSVVARFSTDNIYLTSFLVIFIVLRHLQQTVIFNNTEAPVSYFYKDRVNLIAVFLLLLTFYILIY